MIEVQKDLLTRALDMTEMELRAALIYIINDLYDDHPSKDLLNTVAEAIDTAYNPIRRTGVRL
jgi:hypothetical protein